MVIFLNNAFKKRIDELGRIVIPKQIREDFKINNFDELDIYIDNGNIIIKKNIGIIQYKDKFDRVLKYLENKINFKIMLLCNNNIVSSNFNGENLEKFINNLKYNSIVNYNGLFFLKNSIILDSNYLGDLIFINNEEFEKDLGELKELKNIIIDLIK